jgi:hypothetical protein
MSSLESANGVTTLRFSGRDGTQVEVCAYDGLKIVRLSVDTGAARTDVRFDTGNAGVAAKLSQLFAEAALSQGYSDSLNFDSLGPRDTPSAKV